MTRTHVQSLLALAGAATLAIASPATAAISYSGGAYTQDFDSLPSTPRNANLEPGQKWADDTTATSSVISIPGWYLRHDVAPSSEGGTNGNQRFRVNSPNSTAGSFYSFGNNNSSPPVDPDGADRALGDIGSNTIASSTAPNNNVYIALRLTNTSGGTISEFSLGYTGEQWRDGGSATPAAQSMVFDYSIGATSIDDTGATFTNVPGLTFTSPTFTNTGSGAGLNGNLAANRTVIAPVTVSGINWAPNTDLWLRWNDINHSGNDHGLAIDDLSFSAVVPEPTGLAALGVVAMGLISRRRRG